MTKIQKLSKTLHSSFPGVASINEKIYLLHKLSYHDGCTIQVDRSTDGYTFHKYSERLEITSGSKKKENLTDYSSFRISEVNSQYLLTCLSQPKKQLYLNVASSHDLVHWKKMGKINSVKEVGMLVPNYLYKGKYVLYYGENSFRVAYSEDFKRWEIVKKEIASPEPGYRLKIGTILTTQDGIALIYFLYRKEGDGYIYAVNAVYFDRDDPSRLLWKSSYSIWEQTEEWYTKKVDPVGMVTLNGKLVSYWLVDGEIYSISHSPVVRSFKQKSIPSFSILQKLRENPILKPISEHFWESKATFNPAAIYEAGKVHLVYRAIGDSDMSVLGYAASRDGFHIDERSTKPIYTPIQPFEYTGQKPPSFYSPYISGGGGWGGCEDPRLTKIGKKIYMTYVAYDGTGPPRVALTSINNDDFLAKKWNWEKSVLISPPGVVDKNACLLPEKINGKYVIFHRIFPNILIDYVDDLNFNGHNWIYGRYKIRPRDTSWDSRKVGAGAPPIKTKYGWLLIYHAVGNQDPSKYKTGVMLLDLQDPTKVLFRSDKPILQPEEPYENEGYKHGVAYPCGAVSKDDKLIVYYGGADMVVCAAFADQEIFLRQLMETGSAKLEQVNIDHNSK